MSDKKCSLCKSVGVTMLTCPLNSNSKKPNPNGHPLAEHKNKPAPLVPIVPELDTKPSAKPRSKSKTKVDPLPSEPPTLGNLPDVAMDNILSFLDKKSLIAVGQLSKSLRSATKRYVKKNSILSGKKLFDGPTIQKLAMKGNEDALVYLLTSRGLKLEQMDYIVQHLFTYPIFRRCIPVFYPLDIGHPAMCPVDNHLLLILKNLSYHKDPSIRELAEFILNAQQKYHPGYLSRVDIPIDYPIYIHLSDADSNKTMALQDQLMGGQHFASSKLTIRQQLVIPCLFNMVISTINVPDDKITIYAKLCYYTLLKFRMPRPIRMLVPRGSVDEYSSALATILSITPALVDIVPVGDVTIITVNNIVIIVTETTHNLEELEYLKSLNLHQLHFAHIEIRKSDDYDVLESNIRYAPRADVYLLLHLRIPRSWDHHRTDMFMNGFLLSQFLIGEEGKFIMPAQLEEV